jgi:hypothetical protein
MGKNAENISDYDTTRIPLCESLLQRPSLFRKDPVYRRLLPVRPTVQPMSSAPHAAFTKEQQEG